ncbi:MAG TPA: hypothetical protein VEN79_13270 [Terriglobia bacterium]|nr:hypothetical protein [Terriglobia bacterium]
MKHWIWIVLLLTVSPLVAKDKKLDGYIMNASAFGSIQSYCVDTHNLPPREVKVINQFLARESKPTGLLTRLPWRRIATCQEGAPDAIVRLEFPDCQFPAIFGRRAANGVLLVFRAGSPSPIYETREVLMADTFEGTSDGFDTAILEHDVLIYVVRMLIHDWQKLSETLRTAAS